MRSTVKLPALVACLLLFLLLSSCNLRRYISSPTPLSPEGVSPTSTVATPIVGETPVQSITPDPTQASLPSVPGLMVVYVKEGNLWSWVHGEARHLTQSGRVYLPNISPDGQVIAYLRQLDDFHAELWAINADGKDERRLVSVADLDKIGGGVRDPSAVAIIPYHFEWVPGSHILAFNTQQVLQGPGLSLLDDLNLVDADTGELDFLLLSGWGGEFAYAPDGNQVAISNSTTLFLMNADGSNYRAVMEYTPVITYSEYRYYALPVWSPDGESLRLALPPADPLASPAQPTSLWRIPVDGSPPLQVGSLVAVPFFETPVVFSPDVTRLIYLREVGLPSENLRELLIANADGSGEWVYQKLALLAFEGWAVDSQQFAYSAGEDHAMWLGSIETSAQPFPGDPYGVTSIRWADADHFLFVQELSGAFDLVLGSLGEERLVLDTMLPPPPVYDFYSPAAD